MARDLLKFFVNLQAVGSKKRSRNPVLDLHIVPLCSSGALVGPGEVGMGLDVYVEEVGVWCGSLAGGAARRSAPLWQQAQRHPMKDHGISRGGAVKDNVTLGSIMASRQRPPPPPRLPPPPSFPSSIPLSPSLAPPTRVVRAGAHGSDGDVSSPPYRRLGAVLQKINT